MAQDFEVHEIGTGERLNLIEELKRRLKESQASVKMVAANYHELLMQVDQKNLGESRHAAALRILRDHRQAREILQKTLDKR